MKEKILNFVKEKKELLIFIGVVLAVFSTVMIIANVATKVNSVVTTTTTITEPSPIINEPEDEPGDTPVTPEKVIEKMIRPLAEKDFNISRQFYNENSVLAVDAVIEHNGKYFESYGVSYTTLENKAFDVLATFSGEVVGIDFDDDYNNTVTIKHENGVTTAYSSVSELNVQIGDKVKLGDKIGVASLSNYDKDAKTHVHLELFVDNQKIDPTLAIGKTINEIIALVS